MILLVQVRYGLGIAQLELSRFEVCQYALAHTLATFTGSSPASFMSEKLEDVLCFDNSRWSTLKSMSDKELDDLSQEDANNLVNYYKEIAYNE